MEPSDVRIVANRAGTGKQLLSLVTGERVDLEAGDWVIAQEGSETYITHPVHGSTWVSELLELAPFQDASTRKIVLVKSDGTELPLRDYLRQETLVTWPLDIADRRQPLQVTVHLMLHGFDTSLAFFDMSSVKNELVLDGLTGSSWQQSWWPHWSKKLQRYGVASAWHLRKGSNKRGNNEDTHTMQFHNDDIKYFEAPVWSSFALCALLPQLTATDARKAQATIDGWSKLRDALVARVYHPSSERRWHLFDDSTACLSSGILTGQRPLLLVVVGPSVQWPETHAGSLAWQRLFARRAWETEVSVVGLMEHVHKSGVQGKWMACQLAHCMALDLEEQLQQEQQQQQQQQHEPDGKRPIGMSRRAVRAWTRA
eukprot:2765235-Amphidinium_carterae.1